MNGLNGLRIALVGPLMPPAGGMALQTAQLADLLGSEGAQVEVVQTNKSYWPAWVAQIPVLRAAFRLVPYLFRLWVVTGRCDAMHLMANSGWSWYLFATPAIWISHWRGTPVVINYRGGGALEFLARRPRLVFATLERADALIVPSGFLRDVFKTFNIHATVVPNAVNLSRFFPGKQNECRDQTAPHLIVTRNLESIYDNESAVRALALLRETYPRARLTLAGTGPELEKLQQLVIDLGLYNAVAFAGRLQPAQVADLYRSAQVMWNPSTVDNSPNSVLEALACGVPVVSTNVGGIPYLLSNEITGMLVEPRQPKALSKAAHRVLEDDSLREHLINNGLLEIQRYTWERVKPLLEQIYAQVVDVRKFSEHGPIH
jgi:glycosyltransferase involved in cell wall biosynthesis